MNDGADPARVLIVDDQALMREGLRTLLELEESIEIVGTAVNGVDAVSQVKAVRPDVVLMDVRMPVMDGIEATRAIKAADPGVHVLVLTTFDDDDLILSALRAGAAGYVLKDTPSEQLARDILAVRGGESSLSPSVASKVIASLLNQQPALSSSSDVAGHAERIDADGRERLSERELEVLQLAAKGLSNREIGARLYITEGTVKNHISSVLSKLQMRDRTQAVLYAKEQGWV
jgi:DNA-binding NarL/FixJ family response regulator